MSEVAFVSPVPVRRLAAPEAGLVLDDEASTAKVLVRAEPGSPAANHLAVPYGRSRRLPDGVLACGSRPDEWTLLAEPGAAAAVVASIPPGVFTSVLDLTHGRAMLRLTGADSPAVLAKVCNVDLADDMTPDGAVFSGSVAKVTCDLVRDDRDGVRSYLVSCERSFGRYLFSTVADACVEFGLEVPPGLALH